MSPEGKLRLYIEFMEPAADPEATAWIQDNVQMQQR
jgi:hypothetical protein